VDWDFLFDHLMTGSDFVCHLIEVGLNLLVDSYFLFDHLMTGLDFVLHLIVAGLNFLVDSAFLFDHFVDRKFHVEYRFVVCY
jgi:hypothetical protein